jgi:diphthamide synthase subunit DPH2
MEMINAIKLTASKGGKKYYEVLIGKLNEPKLKNFQFVRFQQFNSYID